MYRIYRYINCCLRFVSQFVEICDAAKQDAAPHQVNSQKLCESNIDKRWKREKSPNRSQHIENTCLNTVHRRESFAIYVITKYSPTHCLHIYMPNQALCTNNMLSRRSLLLLARMTIKKKWNEFSSINSKMDTIPFPFSSLHPRSQQLLAVLEIVVDVWEAECT